MSPEISNAVVILVIGMGSVFAILALIVFLGRQLIKIVNSYATETKASKVKRKGRASDKKLQTDDLVVLAAVVDYITEGKGVVSQIRKI